MRPEPTRNQRDDRDHRPTPWAVRSNFTTGLLLLGVAAALGALVLTLAGHWNDFLSSL